MLDASMFFIKLLKHKHPVVSFKIDKHNYNFPFFAILVYALCIQVVEELSTAIGTIKDLLSFFPTSLLCCCKYLLLEDLKHVMFENIMFKKIYSLPCYCL